MDFAAFVTRVKAMILAPDATFASHGAPPPPWRVAMREHALPMIVGSALVSTLLLILFPASLPGFEAISSSELLLQATLRVFINAGLILLFGGIAARFSEMVGGRNSFDAGVVLIALAMTPLYLGEAILPLPLVGLLAALAGMVYSMMLLWRGAAICLGVPPQARGRFFLMLLGAIILTAIFAQTLLGVAG